MTPKATRKKDASRPGELRDVKTNMSCYCRNPPSPAACYPPRCLSRPSSENLRSQLKYLSRKQNIYGFKIYGAKVAKFVDRLKGKWRSVNWCCGTMERMGQAGTVIMHCPRCTALYRTALCKRLSGVIDWSGYSGQFGYCWLQPRITVVGLLY